MCFSAEASFTAAAVLGVVGCVTLKQVSSKNYLYLALIPLMFALQQFAEGIIWLFLRGNLQQSAWFHAALYTYLIFAFAVWPFWIPLSYLKIEPQWQERTLFFPIVALGALLAVFNIIQIVLFPVKAQIVSHSIQYTLNISAQPDFSITSMSYIAAVTLPFFISSIKNSYIYGFVVIVSIIIVEYLYAYAFASVWCFFAAIFSIIVYKGIKDLKKAKS